MRIVAILAPVAAAVALLGACTSTIPSAVVACGPDGVATTDSDVVLVTNYEAALFYASADAIPVAFYDPSGASDPDAGGGGSTSAAAARAVAASAGNYFPSTCAAASASGNVVTFVLDNCTGPLGLFASTGTVTATLNVQSSSVGVQLLGNNISVNGATINLSSVGTLTASSGMNILTAYPHTTGTGPNGNDAAHTGMYTIVWSPGTGCATINGTLSGSGGVQNVTSLQIASYVTCANGCPQSGTAVSSFKGGAVMLTFNGTSNAQCSSTIGSGAALPLQCR